MPQWERAVGRAHSFSWDRAFYSDDYRAYLRLYSGARWGIMNRVHGAFALASLGKPRAAVVGSDSRARMAGVLGMPEVFVNDATDDWLHETAERLDNRVSTYPAEIELLKSNASVEYVKRLRIALDGASTTEGSALSAAIP